MPRIDLIFILIFISLFGVVLLDLYGIRISFLFEQTMLGTSTFGLLSGILIFYYSILWGCLKMEDYLREKEFKTAFSKAVKFVGFAKPSPRDLLYITSSMVVGGLFNFLSLFLVAYLCNGNLILIHPSEPQTILENIIVPPVSEELIYRGIYLSVFLRILRKNHATATLGIILSSFTFGWIHPTTPILKATAGLLLGSIYLCKWKKNMIASIFAHLGANIVGTYVAIL